MALENCRPTEVFHFFEEICRIPHGSGNEKAISDYVAQFAKERGFWVHQDEIFNVIVKKPGTAGYENAPTVVIQGHLDMVCVKEADTVHDFLRDPIQPYADGDRVRAKGTSLGADNGIAVAMQLALLDAGQSIPHPPLELLFTADEEVGMNGAANLDASLLEGKIFINVDTEEEGEFCASCAGGLRAVYRLPLSYVSDPQSGALQEAEKGFGGYTAYKVRITGLKGGHSGMRIHEERANANVMLGRLLYSLTKEMDLYVAYVYGGLADNAIAAIAECEILVKQEDVAKLSDRIQTLEKTFQNEFRFSDPGLTITAAALAVKPEKAFTRELTNNLIVSLTFIPNGVLHMSAAKEGLVETSCNIGMLIVNEDAIELVAALRSSVASRKEAVLERIQLTAALTGAEVLTKGDYPEWTYEPDAAIRKLFMQTYDQMYPEREKAVEMAIHAGLECGWFAKKLHTSELVSLGPDVYDVHSPDESISISSTERVWELLKTVLGRMKAS